MFVYSIYPTPTPQYDIIRIFMMITKLRYRCTYVHQMDIFIHKMIYLNFYIIVYLPYWFGITSGSVSSPSGGSPIIWGLCLIICEAAIGVDVPLCSLVCCGSSSWQSDGVTDSCVCFTDFSSVGECLEHYFNLLFLFIQIIIFVGFLTFLYSFYK